MKLQWWDKRAIEWQKAVMESDAGDKKLQMLGLDEVPITSFEVKKAILHTRHDMVLLWSSVSSVNAQLQSIKRLLIIVVALLAYLAIRS
jgi:hypothetical protein